MKCPNCNQDHSENDPCSDSATIPTHTEWQWKNTTPGPQTARAGKTWKFNLPLSGTGPRPICQWHNLPSELNITVNNSAIEVTIPSTTKGLYTLGYSIKGHDHLNGKLRLKILPNSQANEPTPAPIKTPPEQNKPLISPAAENSNQTKKNNTSPDAKKTTPPLIAQALLHAPIIHVFCHSKPIPQLKTKLEAHTSLLVGKRSDSKRIFPDIDLKKHFSNSNEEGQCSREQAKIYFKNGHVFIHNLGKSALQTEDGKTILTMNNYNWSVNERIQVPGGIQLLLVDDI